MSCASGDDGDVHECSSTSSSGDCAVVMNLLPGIIGHADFLELHLCFLRVSLTTPRPEYPLPESAEDLSTLDSKTMFLVFVSTTIHNGKGSKRSESGEEMGLCSPGESGFGLRGRRREAEAAHLGLFFSEIAEVLHVPSFLEISMSQDPSNGPATMCSLECSVPAKLWSSFRQLQWRSGG